MRKTRRGFTLLEIMIAVAIVGIIAAVGFPLITNGRKKSDLKKASREIIGHLHWARSLATSRISLPGSGGGSGSGSGSGGGASLPTMVRASGLMVVSNTQYAIFVDDDDHAGNEVTMQIVDLDLKYPGAGMRIVSPGVGQAVRLRGNASLYPNGVSPMITLLDSTGTQRTVKVNGGGVPALQ